MWTLVHPLDIHWITEIFQDILWFIAISQNDIHGIKCAVSVNLT